MIYLWILPQELRSPPRLRMTISGWAQDLEHDPVISPPDNHKKVTHPATLTLNFVCINFSLKAREFWPWNNFFGLALKQYFSFPNCDASICLSSLFIRPTKLYLVIEIFFGEIKQLIKNNSLYGLQNSDALFPLFVFLRHYLVKYIHIMYGWSLLLQEYERKKKSFKNLDLWSEWLNSNPSSIIYQLCDPGQSYLTFLCYLIFLYVKLEWI